MFVGELDEIFIVSLILNCCWGCLISFLDRLNEQNVDRGFSKSLTRPEVIVDLGVIFFLIYSGVLDTCRSLKPDGAMVDDEIG